MTRKTSGKGRGPDRIPGLAKWRRDAIAGGHHRKANTVAAIVRLQRRLANSRAHVAHPRPADFARWQTMEAQLATLQASLASMSGPEPPLPPCDGANDA